MCCGAQICMYTSGGIFGVLGIILIIFWPTWSVDIMYSIMPLSPNSYLYNNWVETPVPLYMIFYLYNWSNPDQIANPNVKPHFTEHGPYVFIDKKEKIILNWDNANSTVTYVDHRVWHFQPQLSGGSADDIIVAPHFPSVTVSKLTRDMPKSIRRMANLFLEREGGALTMTATAMDWLFHGFYDDIFDFVYRLNSPLAPLNSSNFAYFLDRNGSTGAEGNFTIHTGKSDILQLADIKLWKGKPQTNHWDGECGKVNGSTGELYSPGKAWTDITSIFIPEVHRFINLFPKSEINYKGMRAWRYESTDQTFDSGYIAPDTKCFCARNKPCPAPGVIDFSPVVFGAPVYVSHPHFYLADPSYLENITGLQPDHDKHISYLIIEPVLAAPLEAKGQAFVTILVEQDESIDLFKDVAHNFYAPLLRVDISAEITDDLIGFVKFASYTPAIGQTLGIIFAIGGAIVLLIAVIFTATHRWDRNRTIQPEPLENEAGNSAEDIQIAVQENVTEVNEVTQSAESSKAQDTPSATDKPIENITEVNEVTQSPESSNVQDIPSATDKPIDKSIEDSNATENANNATSVDSNDEAKSKTDDNTISQDKVDKVTETQNADSTTQ